MDKYKARLKRIANNMAEDEALWIIPGPHRAITEAYLQQALRFLTALIEENEKDIALFAHEDWIDNK